jgi:hypothetical protein
MKFRTGIVVLAAAGILGTAAIAAAQPAPPVPPVAPVDPNAPPATAPADPNAPPAAAPAVPPPAPPTAPVDPNAQPVDPNAPPAPPVAQEPVKTPPTDTPRQPTVQWGPAGAGEQPDRATPNGDPETGKGPTKPLPWRGTTFTWNQAGTTSIFGVGGDQIGYENEFYGWDFTFAPNIYIVDAKKDKLRAFAEIGWATELTNSDVTTDRNETLFKDMQLGLGYTRSLLELQKAEYKTDGSITGRLVLPTSEASYNQGRYLTTALGLGVKQTVKILGSNADGLNNVTVGVTGTWSHLFARSYQPTNADLERPRQNATGRTIDSDILTSKSFDLNRLTAGLTIDLPLYKDLGLTTAFRVVGRFKHDFENEDGCDVVIGDGSCVEATRLEDRNTYQPLTTFDVALSYPIYEVVGLTLGYNNETPWIGEDGTRRSIFYSPDAQFYLDITANLDVIYDKVSGRSKNAPKTAATPKTIASK